MKSALLLLALLASHPFNQNELIRRGLFLDGPDGHIPSLWVDTDYAFNCGFRNIRVQFSDYHLSGLDFGKKHGVSAISIDGNPIDGQLLENINSHVVGKGFSRIQKAWGMCSTAGARIGIQYTLGGDTQAVEFGLEADGSGQLLARYQQGQWQPLADTYLRQRFDTGMEVSRQQRIHVTSHCFSRIGSNAKDLTPMEVLTELETRFQAVKTHTLVSNWQDEATGRIRGQILQADIDGQPVRATAIRRINRGVPSGAVLWPLTAICLGSEDKVRLTYAVIEEPAAFPWHFNAPSSKRAYIHVLNKQGAAKAEWERTHHPVSTDTAHEE
ncbi:hypothetical protein CO610_03300 [Lysobacteraceae bacterium NML95-0200]|nr:hypothetical protein CO610_03300 [Xanthomonadaceae bacterium NML95-0200]